MFVCLQCGHQNRDLNRFCTSCGSSLARDRCVVARLVLLPEGERKQYLVSEADRILGRDETNDIVLRDDQVSGRHARITSEGDAFKVEDLASRNGTFVNGERIGEATTLRSGDLTKVGRTILKFIL